MDQLVIFLFASYGLWFVVARSELPVWHRARDWLVLRSDFFTKLFACTACSGFWASLAVAFAVLRPSDFTVSAVFPVLPLAFAGSAFIYLTEQLVNRLEAR